ncbi:MAG: serine hydrolase [Anaerolineales bacterium]|nr:serine hydrolase [Anaerolineales bacterium]
MSPLNTIHQICAAFDGRIGLHARHLGSGAEMAIDADAPYPTASAIKLAVLATLMQQAADGQFALESPLMLRRADQIEGSGLLRYLTPGLTLTLRDWAFLMMRISDNTATNVLIDHVGLEKVQAWLHEHGFANVCLHQKLSLKAVRQDQTHFGTATPRGLNRLLTAVFQREIVSPEACDEMLRMMDTVGEERVGRYLPFTPWGAPEPPEGKLRLAGKTGSFVGTRVQTAVFWRGAWQQGHAVALTVMTTGNPQPETWHVDAPGVLAIGRIARLAYDAFLA